MPQPRPEIRAAREPLTPQEFQDTLERGLGRAILCLQKHDPAPYKQIILEACLKDTRYDTQCEGSRVPYLMEAIDLVGDTEFFAQQILEAYPATPSTIPDFHESSRLEDQFSDFALAFAQRGNTWARQLLFDSFAANPEFNDKFGLGRASNIIELDGLAGLDFVLEQYTTVAKDDPEFKIDAWYMATLVRRYGANTLLQHLQDISISHPDIAALLERGSLLDDLKENPPSTKTTKPRRLSYEDLVRRIHYRSPYPGGVAHGAKSVSQATLKRAARDLLLQTNPELIRGYLYVFRRRRFPLSVRHLLKLVKHENEDVRLGAFIAMQQIQHAKVRQLALADYPDLPSRIEAVGMLESNYEAGDDQLVLQTIHAMPDDDHMHWLGYRILDIYRKNSLPEGLEPLTALYELNPCAICRATSVILLQEIGLLPDWMLEEVQWDSYQNFRKKVRAWATA